MLRYSCKYLARKGVSVLEDTKLSPWIQIRVNEEDKKLAKSLADDYGTDMSSLIKALLQYADKHRPTLVQTVVLRGKALAPMGMNR